MYTRNSSSTRSRRAYARRVALSAFALVASTANAVALAHGSDYGNPADPTSSTAPLVLHSAVERSRIVDVRPRVWRELFWANGALRKDPPLAVTKRAAVGGHVGHGRGRLITP